MSDLPNRSGSGKENAALSIVFENYLKLVKFNVFTGQFRLIKTYHDHRDKDAEAFDSFYEYAKSSVRKNALHKDDIDIFLRYLDPDYLAGRLMGGSGGKHIMLHGPRCCILNEYKNVTIEMIASKDFSRERPWAIMGISCPEKIRSHIGAELGRAYRKIVHVRLSDGYYEPVYMTESEISAEESLAPGIVNWFSSFALAGNVYEDDRGEFLDFLDTKKLCRNLAENGEVRISYRRRINGEYRPVCMEVVPSPDHSPEDPRAFIYIYEQDHDDKYMAEREAVRKYFSFSDILTGIRNRQCYDELCRKYAAAGRKEPVGVLYAKLAPEEEEAAAANEIRRIFAIILMDTFGRDKSFRIGENEFAAVSFGGDCESFRRRAARFCSEYRQSVNHKVMTGFFRDEAAESISSVMDRCREYAACDNLY